MVLKSPPPVATSPATGNSPPPPVPTTMDPTGLYLHPGDREEDAVDSLLDEVYLAEDQGNAAATASSSLSPG